MENEKQSDLREGVEYTYDSAWTESLESREHWVFYWYQQKLMEGLVTPGDDRILEIGVGSGFTANYCRHRGLKVTTLDIDADKDPDIVANVVSYDFKDTYDHLMAFEVMEHIPYREFERLMKKLPSFIDDFAFLSLPRNELSLVSLDLELPKLPRIQWEWSVPARTIQWENHHWELGYREYTRERVRSLWESAGLELVRELRCSYIDFFALKTV